MTRHQFREIRLRDFRCFHREQTARLAPLTLLVGDNSTGKTSFLAAVRAIWEVAYQSSEPDFRASPYDLGAFPEIVHSRGEERNRAATFGIGFSGLWRRRPIKFDVAFKSHAAAPSLTTIFLEADGVWFKYTVITGTKSTIDFGSMAGSWRMSTNRNYRHIGSSVSSWIHWIRRGLYELNESSDQLENLDGTQKRPTQDDLDKFNSTLGIFTMFARREQLFASAPIRSSPRRTYDPIRLSPDPEGTYVPTYFANINFQNHEQWLRLKEQLEMFGRTSGLFHEIGVKQLGDMEGGPFQLEITKYDEKGERQRRNLIDVGYGVSQVLPVLAELFRSHSPSMFLFQQPEVHLHPSAQAALGSLFCETASSGRQLIIETHSDYIVDRVLLDIRDKRTGLKSDDISILYFEREGQDVSIHSIRIDEEGNVLDTPKGYRRFFKDELNRVIDY